MNVVNVCSAGTLANHVLAVLPPTPSPASDRPLQRLGEVREQEGLTQNRVAQRLGISVHEVQEQERPSSDMPLSQLYRWHEALGVPVTELLRDSDGELSQPVQLRARLLLMMKTVRSIQSRVRQASVRRLADTLAGQLVEMMPELADTGPWPTVGRRRAQHELGQAFFRRLSVDPLDELEEPEGEGDAAEM